MKFEKLNENKIRVTLTIQDLVEKEIDFHIFMSNPIESQHILLDMLEEAKKETGFDPEDSNLKVEALSMADTSFVFTITKLHAEETQKSQRKKFTVKRKSMVPLPLNAVYCFNSFDDFCNFLIFINKNSDLLNYINNLAESIKLYEYKNKYYLLLNNTNKNLIEKNNFYTCIIEFSKCIINSKVFYSKLIECGTLIMENNALEIGIKHFVTVKK